MNIMVTGATGFIGSLLVERLIQNNYNVIALKRSHSDTWRLKDVIDKCVFYDVDKVIFEEIFKTEKIDFIIHLATNYGRRGETVEDIIKSNISFPSALLYTALNNGLKGFINTDTSAPESYTFYASTKKAFLSILKYFNKERDLNIINLRLEYVYGPKDDDSKFIPCLVRSILEDRPLEASLGTQKRDYIYVDDVVDAYLKSILLAERTEKRFISIDIGSGSSESIKDFAGMVGKIASKRSRVNWGALKFRKNEIMHSKADMRLSEELLNWTPSHTLDTGLRKTVDWYMRGESNA